MAATRPRLMVALLVPPPLDAEVDGLRRAAGDRARVRIAPHVTLAPPTNVADVGAALDVVHAAAATQDGPLVLDLGPVATFDPTSRVAFLAVGGPGAGALEQLQAACARGPFDRPRTHAFVPHVTVRADLDHVRRDAWIAAGADYHERVAVATVVLLEQQADADGRRWEVLADAVLAPVVVVGRGGLPVELTQHHVVDPVVGRALGVPSERPGLRPDDDAYVVVARRHGALAGVAVGRIVGPVLHVRHLVVAAAERGTGVGSHLLATVDALAGAAGAGAVVVDVPPGGRGSDFLRSRGFGGEPGATVLSRAVRTPG